MIRLARDIYLFTVHTLVKHFSLTLYDIFFFFNYGKQLCADFYERKQKLRLGQFFFLREGRELVSIETGNQQSRQC